MISDLNFDSVNEGNYTTEEPSGSSFLAGMFPNYGQANSYPNQIQNIIFNFNQDGYYMNCPYDSSIYPHPYQYYNKIKIIFGFLPLEPLSSRQNRNETCEFLASKTRLIRSVILYQSLNYGPPLLEHISLAAWRDGEIPYPATYPECVRCMVSSNDECGNK
jgi:hypothetical protein